MIPGTSLTDVFSAQARRDPRRVAVSAGGARTSYGELDARSEAIGRRLRARGVGAGSLVGLSGHRGAGLIAGLLGILKAGAAYVPLDPAYPPARLRYLIEDTGVKLVVADAAGRSALAGHDIEMIDVDGPAAGDDPRLDGGPSAGDLAYVIHTSGSTGAPKGVLVEHGNVLRLFEQTESWFGFGERDVWTMFHSASFDFSVWEMWGALLYGGRLVIVPPAVTRSPADLFTLLADEGVTVLNQTPSAFRQLCTALDTPAGNAPLALRVVVFGGERLDTGMLRPWAERFGTERPQLVNMYGITETTVHVTYRPIRAADLDRPQVSPIGVPIPDLRVTVRDDRGAAAPAGTPGEIWVSGPGVARGYLDRPGLTAERFVTDEDGRRAYRSGDLAVRDEHGELHYLGRIDDQIKIRGFRIEPYEIEAVLREQPGVAEVVVAAHDFGDGDLRLVAYLRPEAGQDGDRLTEDLARYAAERLPRHLCPARYELVAEIPATPQGKADRAALAAAAPAAGPTGGAAEASAGADPDAVAEIVREVLRRDTLPYDADLFDLGATSLAFIRVIARVNERWQVSLTGSELGEIASVERLCAVVRAARSDRPVPTHA
ncbi:amino acid adenylation domain-containing protein [Paractinoplanes atraurantiacus]|uniref:Amino acid adenylation domain-containing protein n=1 Tax=Paractinoplanes atraurantiacus TaxID=1036182 RepID=A0A285GLQ7_9ACTN|nr:amino acid adenylation domain-containing protein [Actinoplanes atraurantiacus]SNY24385.1 amino acid adenylation domain-containing protein [Actinoplanes atraurantiacus]